MHVCACRPRVRVCVRDSVYRGHVCEGVCVQKKQWTETHTEEPQSPVRALTGGDLARPWRRGWDVFSKDLAP